MSNTQCVCQPMIHKNQVVMKTLSMRSFRETKRQDWSQEPYYTRHWRRMKTLI